MAPQHEHSASPATLTDTAAVPELPRAYLRACRLAVRGRHEQARGLYAGLVRKGASGAGFRR